MSIRRYCQACGAVFHVYPYVVKRGWGKYCSEKCCRQSFISWSKGKHLSKETKKKISEGIKKAHERGLYTNETNRKISRAHKGKRKIKVSKKRLMNLYCKQNLSSYKIAEMFRVNRQTIINYLREKGIPIRTHHEASKTFSWNRGLTKETSAKVRKIAEKNKGKPRPDLKKLNKDPIFNKKKLRGRFKRPTKIEQKLIEIIKRERLPFKYVGNGELIIAGRCPDFVHISKSKVIELFGRYWHSPSLNPLVKLKYTYDKTIEHYQKNGFDCLILWGSDLKDKKLISKNIMQFIGE